ncbi:OLC1v1029875C1 [Oldenlandia corymbosa var. corymbosa]|uniref:OLC1v1029875C1 n=1 Tax=Oldenlandia corymbosa var. corymbosa TaxID=529605 RepID=A0AAV1CI29_OLDCO|nr:OLC1v1029875C1 [Oldenlandia corymbosa var. corymbosa]
MIKERSQQIRRKRGEPPFQIPGSYSQMKKKLTPKGIMLLAAVLLDTIMKSPLHEETDPQHLGLPGHRLPVAGRKGDVIRLEEAFRLYFLLQKKFRKAREELFTIKQKDQETLRAYVEHFAEDSAQIGSRSDEILIVAFINGLRHGRFYTEFMEDPPDTFKEVLKRANKYARGEEANRKCRDESQSACRPKVKSRGLSPSIRRSLRERLGGIKSFRNLTPLNKTPKEIL